MFIGAVRTMHREQFTPRHHDRLDAPNIAIVLTDGMATLEINNIQRDAEAAQNDNIEMIAIGVTSAIDVATLQLLSSDPKRENQNYFRSPNFMELGDIVQELIQNVRCVVPDPPPQLPGMWCHTLFFS